jgi:uncharacterized membrane protein
MTLVASFLIGVVAGLRSLTAPALVSWGAYLGWVDADGTWASWVGHPITVTVLTVLAVVELITDKLPKTPSRTTPTGFAPRIITGGFSGAVICIGLGAGSVLAMSIWGAILGVVGAVLGTLGGYQLRKWLAGAFGRDLPAAVLEDAIAVLGALAIVSLL